MSANRPCLGGNDCPASYGQHRESCDRGRAEWGGRYMCAANAVAEGAERERRRIRRAQANALKLIRSPNSGMTRDYYADIIDAATKAPRKRRT